MKRTLYDSDHEQFRDTVREFLTREVVPHHARWEAEGIVERSLYVEAGKQGVLGFSVPEEYGGGGLSDDFRFNAVVNEELCRAFASGPAFTLQNDVLAPYLIDLTTEEQKQRWLPGFASGELIAAVAMTEPGTGSDLQGIRTSAVLDGDDWVLNGSKTFISCGINADLVFVVTRTDPAAGSRGFTLLAVERGMPGFERGRNLDKVGLHAQDTAELSFTDVRVPASNVVGGVGKAFGLLMRNLPQERLSIAITGVAASRAVLDVTLDYVKQRTAFGQSIGSFQNTRFVLAELDTEVDIAQVYVDRMIPELSAGTLTDVDAAKAKLWCTELQLRVVDACVQLHGGYGYMTEYPVARAYADARVQTIYGGSSEIMKEIVGRSLGLV